MSLCHDLTAAADVDRCVALREEAVTIAPPGSIDAALAAALRWDEWAAGHGRWPEAAAAYRHGLDALTRQIKRQEQRAEKVSRLGDALGLPAAAAHAHTHAGELRGAVAALDGGRAMLLTDALAQRRVIAHAPGMT
jgi:hypothetical protein